MRRSHLSSVLALLLLVGCANWYQQFYTNLQRNRGVVALAIVKSSPAFMADLLRGDVILRLGGDDVADAASFMRLLYKYEGQDAEIVFLRNGEQQSKVVHLNRAP